MKKTNKTSFIYIISSVSLLLLLIFGGCYGIYVSVGMDFIRRGVSTIADTGATNVSFGGMVNFETSMFGVIILSVILVVLAVLDFVSLIKQISFFKQFSIVKNSTIAQTIEKKNKRKGKTIFFAFFIDILSLIAGVLGIFINMRTFPNGNMVWIIYVVDGLIALLSVISIIFLIIKIKQVKKIEKEIMNNISSGNNKVSDNDIKENNDEEKEKVKEYLEDFNLNKIEYKLLKLKQLKSSKIINNDEYEFLRKNIIRNNNSEE